MKHNAKALLYCAAWVFTCLWAATASATTTLRYTDHEPYGNMRTRLIKETFFRAIETESLGRLKIDAHWNGELSTSYNALTTISQGGVADMGTVVPEYTPDLLPRHQIFKSFPLGPASGNAQAAAFERIFKNYRQFGNELEKNNVINLQFFLGYPVVFFTTQPNVKLDQLNASKWRTASFWHQSFLRNAGGVPVNMPWNEHITDALKDGQLDGLMVNLDSGHDIHAERAAPYIQVSPSLWLGHVYLLVMNKAVWDSLDVKDRGAIRRAAAATQKRLGAAQEANLAEMTNAMKREGATIHYLTNDELKAWQTATGYQQVQAEWVTQQENKGISDAGMLMQGVSSIINQTLR